MTDKGATPFPRIARDLDAVGVRPWGRGLRVTVGMILRSLGDGVAVDGSLEACPYIGHADPRQAIRSGVWLAQERGVALAPAA